MEGEICHDWILTRVAITVELWHRLVSPRAAANNTGKATTVTGH